MNAVMITRCNHWLRALDRTLSLRQYYTN